MKELTLEQIKAFQTEVRNVDLSKISISDLERSAPRKEQGSQTRILFRRLNLKGISVTARNYSMAQSVDIRIPKIGHYEDAEAQKLNSITSEKIRAILYIAFPNHRDKSDSISDHYDYCWSF